MKECIAAFTDKAANVYRTKEFIVKQVIGVQYDSTENNVVYSHDIYFKRTKERDELFESIFAKRKRIDGKRLPTTMYARTYVE